MHLPIFSLVSGAVGRFMGFKGLFVDRYQWEVAEDVFDLTRFDVISFDLGQRHTDVPGAVRSLIIGEVDNRQFCVLITLIRITTDVEDYGFKGSGSPPPAPHGLFEGLELPLEICLILFEGFDLISDRLEVGLGLSHSDLGADEEKGRYEKYAKDGFNHGSC